MIWAILYGAILVIYAAFMLSYAFAWSKMPILDANLPRDHTPLTVLVAFRNEEDSLPHLLRSFEQLDYSKERFEVILLDDHSSDTGPDIIQRHLEQSELNIRMVALEALQGKKAAIRRGIELAENDMILCTDADCTFGSDWLSAMVGKYQEGAKFISGPVMFVEEQNIWQKMMQLEFAGLIAFGGASIAKKKFTMANGANLAFSKKAFFEISETVEGTERASGDDVYLLKAMGAAFPNDTVFVKSREAIVRTKYETSVGAFIRQRMRWASKGIDVGAIPLVPALVYSTNFVSFLLMFTLFEGGGGALAALAGLATKTLIDWVFYLKTLPFFGKSKLHWLVPLVELLYMPYVSIIGFFGLNAKYQWKGRKTR